MRRATILATTAALALAGCGSHVNEQAVGTRSGQALVTCFKMMATHALPPNTVVSTFNGWDTLANWVKGTMGPNFKHLYGTDCGAPTKPLTLKEKQAAKVVIYRFLARAWGRRSVDADRADLGRQNPGLGPP